MKPLYILNPYSNDIRRERATQSEIEDVLVGKSTDRLAQVTLGPDGDMVVTNLTDADLAKLRLEFEAHRAAELRVVLDASLTLFRNSQALDIQWSSPITIWPQRQRWAEEVVRSWAAERGLEVEDESPPRDRETWIRTANIKAPGSYYSIVHMQWPSVQLGEVAIAVEALCIGLASAFTTTEAA